MPHARKPRRNKRYVKRPTVIPMLVKSQCAIGPLEDWLRQIEIHETVDSVQGEAILRSHGDGFAYPAAGAVDGVADFFEMWATRHGKTRDVSALRQVAVRLANGAPIDHPLMERVKALLPTLRRIGAFMNCDDAEDLIRQTQIKAELEAGAARAQGA
ncbi:hypothetical protein [Achromobacter xylosoxidans]|uniref:hypothetical protein n=1 Tax=Alcaligenes xylosoxydans xylosoxydans TaxID=85698 RepID=UPI0009705609|nr:hypothetical protein [Achromobacter xylosoxidans]OMG81444.1 hypothetical protein BIZ53_29670 [Achromobacter xylosoxidans]